jgi:MoaA/NifB/PqqE/SkfB family radical SAM enzyme
MIVLWRVTERCNFGCSFCAYDRGLRFVRHDVTAQVAERFGRLLGEWSRATGESVLLSWLGGEPTLWPPLFAVSEMLKHDYGIAISATTNGSTLHRPDVRSHILDSFAELTVSIDGLVESHDRVRRAPGSWARISEYLPTLIAERDAQQRPLKLRANIVLMGPTLAEFPDLCHTLADWGIDEITFNQLGGRDRPEFYPGNRLSANDVAALRQAVPALRDALSDRGTRLCSNETYLDRIAASTIGEPLRVEDCAPGERFLFIDERGMIAPCSFTADSYGVPITDIATIGDLMDLPERFRQARTVGRSADCDDCPSTQIFSKFAA